MPPLEGARAGGPRLLAALLAAAAVASGCEVRLGDVEAGPEATAPPRHYSVQLEVQDGRSGPGGAVSTTSRSTARLTETRDRGARRVVVDFVTGEAQPASSAPVAGVVGAGVDISAKGEARVVAATELDLRATMFVLQLVMPVVAYQPPASLEVGSTVAKTPGAVREGARQPEKARDLDAERVASTVRLTAAAPFRAYDKRGGAYVADSSYLKVFPGPSQLERPTRAESYVVDPGPGIADTVFRCIVTLTLGCPETPYDPPPQQRSRTVTVDGPSSVDLMLKGAIDFEVSSLVYDHDRVTLLQSTATGRQDLSGTLTAGPGVPAAVSGKPARATAGWTASAELTDEWPRPPARPGLPVAALIAAALLLAVGAGAAATGWRRFGR